MEQELQDSDAVRYTLEDKLYQEYDKDKKVVYSRQLKHGKSVRFTLSNGWYTEYDEWGRTTFNLDSSGYWCLKFYDEPTNPDRVKVTPYQVVHKYWTFYNDVPVWGAEAEKKIKKKWWKFW